MTARKPKPGTVLSNDDEGCHAVVVERGMSDEQIKGLLDRAAAMVSPDVVGIEGYDLATYHRHSARQLRDDYCSYDEFWSSEGECKTSTVVAIPRWAQ